MTDERTAARAANRLPEEVAARSEAPTEQAQAILADSDEGQNDRDAASDTALERRRSDETVPDARPEVAARAPPAASVDRVAWRDEPRCAGSGPGRRRCRRGPSSVVTLASNERPDRP
ncbi:MAG TPA: hypothetical protein VG435_07025 [Acidimicrobiales bacterium]|nr:hypothetical protein [Acidimicrobiales bacterium]